MLASRKEGLLPECCREDLHAKQTGRKLSKKTRTNIGLCDSKTEQMPLVFVLEKIAPMIFYNYLSGMFDGPSEGRLLQASRCNRADLRCKA